MTCRHGKWDPACSSYQARVDNAYADGKKAAEILGKAIERPATPDIKDFDIEDVYEATGPNGVALVLIVKYPNCAKCSFEGTKAIVYNGFDVKAAIRWRKIDPHFQDPKTPYEPNAAPPPTARFPASPQGISLAKVLANYLVGNDVDEGR